MAETRTVAILAGGASRRMGRDKSQLIVAGETLLARTIRLALEAESDVLVIGGPHAQVPKVRFVQDERPGEGPLAALTIALEAAAPNAAFLLCACDMPRLTRQAFIWTFDQAKLHAERDGLAIHRGDQIEPLFSIYRSSCLSTAKDLLSKGTRSLRALLDLADFAAISAPPWLAEQVINVNTAEEWHALNVK